MQSPETPPPADARLAAARLSQANHHRKVRSLRAIRSAAGKKSAASGAAALQQLVTRKTLELEARNHQLKQSEETFANAFEHAPIGVALVSPEGRWLKVNRSLCELVGYPEEELLTLDFQRITHPDDLDLDLENMRRLVAGEIRSYQMEKRYFRRDGSIAFVLLHVSLVRDRRNEPLYFISQIQDITARKLAERRRHEEEERTLRQRNALIAFTAEARGGEDLAATIRKLTETAARTLGVARVSVWRYTHDRSAIRCVDLYELDEDRHSEGQELPAENYPEYFRALETMDVIPAADAHHDPRTREFSENYLRPLGITSMLDAPLHFGGAGEGVLCHEHIGPARRWTADEETFAAAVANRVSLALEAAERQRVEDELRGALAQIEQMLTHSPAIIFRLKIEDGMLMPVTASENIAALLGYTVTEALAPGWWLERVHPDDRGKALAGLSRLMAHGTHRFEYRFRHKQGGYRWIEDNQRLLGSSAESVGIWMDVTGRKEAEARFEKLNRELLEISRQAGMAEVASNVLHNVGNVLNSVNVSCSVAAEKVRKSRIGGVEKLAGLLSRHSENLPEFLTRDPVGSQLPDFVAKLATRLAGEREEILRELESLGGNIDHIKEIVAMQQGLAKVSGTAETLDVAELARTALRLNAMAFHRNDIRVVTEFDAIPPVTADKHKLLQILVNLLRNAAHACDDSGRPDKRLTLRVSAEKGQVRITVSDNGVGIRPENLTRVFGHGFTTRKHGHGFGLHSAALAAGGIGGELHAHSDGPGTGATFTLEFPLAPAEPVKTAR